MKAYFTKMSLLFAIVLLAVGFQNCKPKEEEEIVRIQDVVPQSIIDSLTNKGMVIHKGNKPPKLDLAINVSPYELVTPWGPNDSWKKGHIISDYLYKFYGQTNPQEITYDYHNSPRTDEGKGQGAFIIGTGNKFTIFSEDSGVASDIPYKSIAVISGELDGTTVKNFQYAFVFKEKTGDAGNNVLIPVNTGRLWKDGDGVSESTSSFRVATSGVVGVGSVMGNE